MTTENLSPENLDAAKPAAPPANYIDADMIPKEALEHLDRFMSPADRDKLEAARIAGREAKRAAQAKAREEDAASSARAKAAVDELVRKDRETPEDEKPTTDPAVKGYELEVPEVSEGNRQILEDTVHDVGLLGAEVGIPADQLQQLVNVATDFALQEPEGLDYENYDACVNVLRGKWGEDYDKRVAVVQAQVAKWGKDVQEYLNLTGLANSPGVNQAIYEFASKGQLTGLKAMAEIAAIKADPKHPYWAGDKKAVAEMRMLQEVSNKFAAKDPAKTPSRTASASSASSAGIHAEIAKIRADKNYTSLDAKVRGPLVARVNALCAQLGGA